MSEPEIRSFVTLTTGHITRQTADWLEDNADNYGGSYGNYGWFLWCSEEQGNCLTPIYVDDVGDSVEREERNTKRKKRGVCETRRHTEGE